MSPPLPVRLSLLLGALCALTVTHAPARAVPTIDRPVVDLTGLLGADAVEAVSGQLVALRDKTGVQMAVLIVGTTNGVPIEDYAHTTFNTWGGGSKERNDGVLFVLAIEDRRNRIEVGRGLEALITDSRAVAILEGVKPRLREADYAGAASDVVAGVAELVAHLTPGAAITIPAGPLELNSHHLILVFGIPWALGVGFLLLGKKKRRKRADRGLTISLRTRILSLFLAGPILASLLLLALDGGHYVGANLLAWCVSAGLGLFAGMAIRKGPIRGTFLIIMLCFPAFLVLVNPAAPVPDGLDLVSATMAFAFSSAILTGFFVADGEGGGSGSSSSSWSSGSSSSSWSSSSSSSSSSGSSWSGGGGSSGGGGASSSW